MSFLSDMNRWYEDITSEISRNLESFTEQFFGSIDRKNSGKTDVKVSPCPFCGHNGCFSVHAKGVKCHSAGCTMNDNRSYVNTVAELYGGDTKRARKEIAEFTGIRIPDFKMTPKQREERDKKDRLKEIKRLAVEFYHANLMNNQRALDKQIGMNIKSGERAHEMQDLVDFKIGLSENYLDLHTKLIGEGFVKEEIKEAKVFFPDGYFVYPYFDQYGEMVRMNGKLCYRSCQGKKLQNGEYDRCDTKLWDLSDEAAALHEANTGHRMASKIHSVGEKLALFGTMEDNSKHSRKKKVIIVEGENDAIAVHRMLRKLKMMSKEYAVIALGGSFSVENMRISLLNKFEEMYTMFDHDDAGDGYLLKVNLAFPDKPLYNVPFTDDYNDIDDYIKSDQLSPEHFEELFKTTEYVPLNKTEDDHPPYFIQKSERSAENPNADEWVLKNREVVLRFELHSISKTNTGPSYNGKLYYQQRGAYAPDVKSGSLETMNLSKGRKESEFRMPLLEEIKRFYSQFPERDGMPMRSIDDIADALRLSPVHHTGLSQIAAVMSEMDQASKEYNMSLNNMRIKLSNSQFDELVTEITSRRMPKEHDDGIITPIVLSHHFDLVENFACVYFPQILKGDFDDGYGSDSNQSSDSDSKTMTNSARRRIVPTLLTNDKQFIRLDYLRRKSPQDLLMIKNKYVMEEEIQQNPFTTNEVSLTDGNVRKYLNGEYTKEELSPRQVVLDMENMIRQFYYFPPERDFWYKMLAIWIYGTYYYMLFAQYPYLLIDGVKGSGKSTIDSIIYRLGFNAKLSANSSPAALYRMINQQGGVIILDEMENLYDKKVLDSGDIGPILKSGYSDGGRVYRVAIRNDEQVTVGYRVYGPKVISNINGVDEVLESRCINLKTPRRVTADTVKDFKDAKLLYTDRQWNAKARDISSRATLSTLQWFKEIGEVFHDNGGLRREREDSSQVDKDETPRTSQILAPLLTIAKVCGPEFLEAFHLLYNEEIVKAKKQAQNDSIEGMIKNIVTDIARDCIGIKTELIDHPLDNQERLSPQPIVFEKETGFFTFNTAHIREFLEELDPALYEEEKLRTDRGKNLNFRALTALLKELFTPTGEILRPGSEFKRSQLRTNEDFDMRYRTNKRISIAKYRLHVADFVDDQERMLFSGEVASAGEDDLF